MKQTQDEANIGWRSDRFVEIQDGGSKDGGIDGMEKIQGGAKLGWSKERMEKKTLYNGASFR